MLMKELTGVLHELLQMLFYVIIKTAIFSMSTNPVKRTRTTTHMSMSQYSMASALEYLGD